MTQSFTQSNVKIGWRPYVSPVPSTILLDLYSGAAVAYSLRKLKSSYAGSAIRVRRSSDNTEQNIGFDANGNLDTSSMLSFVGAGNGFVTTWYDQSGNNKNAIQTTASAQPQIVSSGALITLGGRPAISWDGSNDTLVASSAVGAMNGLTTLGIISVVKPNTQSLDHGRYAHLFFPESGGWGEVYQFASNSGLVSYRFGTSVSGNTPSYTTSFTGTTYNNLIMSTYKNGANEITRVNGKDVIVFSNKAATIANTTNTLHLGFGEFNSYFGGRQSEVIIYTTNKMTDREPIESNINSYYSIFDNEAEAFIDAAVLSSGQSNSVRTLVSSLKSSNIWSKLKAIYPFVGGNANAHKRNLKDPRDLDAAYRLTFYGGWSHWASGPQGNGYDTYADTYLNPSLALSPNSSSIGIWVPNGMNNHGFGVWTNGGANRFSIIEQGGGYLKSQMTSSSTEAWGITNTTSGFIMGSRTSASSNKIYRFGSLITVHPTYGGVPYNTTANTAAYPNSNFWLGKVNGNTSISNYGQLLYFAYIGDGLTDSEILALSNAAYSFRQSIGYY